MVQSTAEDLMDGLGVMQASEAIAQDTIKEAEEPLQEEEILVCLGVIGMMRPTKGETIKEVVEPIGGQEVAL